MREQGHSPKKHCVSSVDHIMPHAESTKNAAVYNKVTVRNPQRRHWRASNNATSMRPTKHSINAKQKRASIQPSPHKEPLGLYAHAHGI